jgi:penicillin-binding protein 1A
LSDDWSLPPYSFDPPPEQRPEPEPEPTPPPGRKGKAPKAAKPPKPPRERKARKPSEGRPFDPRSLFTWMAAPGLRWVWLTLLTLSIVGLLGAVGGGIYIWRKYLTDVPPMPAREALFAVNRAPGIRFQDRTGVQIAVRGPRYGERVTLDQLPAYVPRAFLAAEDRRFYQHGALDLQGISRAAWINWRAGRIVQGGSTITQQIAKGLFLTPDQTAKRKLQEAVMARRLYAMLSRDEILELYLNRIFFGANTYGIDGASRAYFGHPASKMSISEAALLASLPKAPSRLALTRNMAGALERQRLILANMRREKWITEAEYQAALADTPKLAPGAAQEEGELGYILDYATVEAVKIAGQNSPDLVVRLTIDSRLQAAGAQIVRDVMRTDGAKGGATQAALLALGNDGAIRAMVGGTDFDETPFNRAVQARRQPGSTFKPFVYAAALEKGVLPTDQRVDGPVKFGEWAPENYGGGYAGPVTIETALAKSINTVAAKLGQEVGGSAMGELARRFGLSTIPPNPDLSVALGSYEVSLLQLVGAFQVFQQGGQRRTPYIIESIATVGGESIYQRQPASLGVTVYDIAKASMMVNMMKGVIERGTGTRAAFGRPAAGKTGTSQNWRDAWFVGFTPDMTAGVWIGNDDDRPMNHVAGGTLPAAIWRRFMIIAHEGLPARDFDWLMPDPVPEEVEDPRNPFYGDLASDFARTADSLAADAAAPPPAPVEPPKPATPQLPPGEVIPY